MGADATPVEPGATPPGTTQAAPDSGGASKPADAGGTDLGNQCSSASAMATQVESVVTTMNVTHLDFDIESSEETNATDYTRTAQALAQVRSWASSTGRTLNISYTLPVLPSGFTSDGMNVLNAAQSNGFKPDIVNIITMDYGSSGTEMGSAANQALDAAAGQVAGVFGVSAAAAYGMLGNTPMICQNDSPGEIFTQADASATRRFGGLGLGLPMVRHVARAHGGDVVVDSQPGRGTTFTLTLPAERGPAGMGPARSTR